jgi:hypothetical protein
MATAAIENSEAMAGDAIETSEGIATPATEAPVAPIARKGAPLPSTVEDKLVHAQSLKELANDNFRQGNIKKAKNIYHKIFAFTSGLQEGSSSGIPMLDATGFGMSKEQQSSTSATKEQLARAEELCVLANSNLAACALRLEQPQRAISYCREALKLRQESPKVRGVSRRARSLSFCQRTLIRLCPRALPGTLPTGASAD